MSTTTRFALLVVSMLLSCTVPAMASSTTFCASNTTLNMTTDQFIFNGTATTHVVVTENQTCPTGCSNFMNECRGSQFNQSLLVLGLIVLFVVVMIVAAYLSRDIPFLEVGIGIVVAIMSFVVGLTDTFSNGYGYVFYGLGILFLIASILLTFKRRADRNG